MTLRAARHVRTRQRLLPGLRSPAASTGQRTRTAPPGPGWLAVGLRPMRHARVRIKEHSWKSTVKDTALAVVVVLALSWLINTALLRSFSIPSASMYPTFHVSDRVVVSQLVPDHFPIQRGDIVVFTDPGGWLPTTWNPGQQGGAGQAVRRVLVRLGVIADSGEAYVIKRVIGMPGDLVVCCDGSGLLTINGHPLEEDYLPVGMPASQAPFTAQVPPDMLFVLGDNRAYSGDSRSLGAGLPHRFVPTDNVVGGAVAIVWPVSRIQWIHRPSQFTQLP